MNEAMLVAVVMILMRAVKASPIVDWLIPFIAFLVGAIGACLVGGWSAENVLKGIFLGASAVGLHQSGKQLSREFGPDKPCNEPGKEKDETKTSI
jgi:hypothetical protein